MQVNGYQIREALKRWNLRRDLLAKQIETLAWQFPGETKTVEAFTTTDKALGEAETAVAQLEDLQQVYNQKVSVSVDGRTGPLSLLVKQVRFCAARENFWKTYLRKTADEGYRGEQTLVRETNKVTAVKVLPTEQAMVTAERCGSLTARMRAAIAQANGTNIEVDDSYKATIA
jgi:hypothetical protein